MRSENLREMFYVGSFGQNFSLIEFDRAAEALRLIGCFEAPGRQPDVFALDAEKKVLYAGLENGGGKGGVCAFDIRTPESPRLISHIPLETDGPCYVALVQGDDAKYLVGSGYFDGRVQAFRLDDEGAIREMTCDEQFEGKGPFHYEAWGSKQDHARMHCAVPIPNTRYFACANLGGDTIHLFQINGGRIEQVALKKTRPGTGPRHIACAASGRIWYLVDELDSFVSVLSFDPETLEIEILQRISALPDWFTGDSWCSAIHLSPDEKYLYVGNRGYDSLTVFSVQDGGKRLVLKEWFADHMSKPREFAFDATGDYMLIGGMHTGCVTLNRVSHEDGTLSYVSRVEGVKLPTCFQSIG